jgi:hypothetical protein
MEVADDVALARLMKRSGARCAVVNAREQLRLNLYPSLAAAQASMEKGNFAILGRYRVSRSIAAATMMLLFEAAPIVALLPVGSISWTPLLGLAWLLLGWCACVPVDRWLGRSPRGGLSFPLGALLSAYFTVRSALLGWRNGGVRWRGTFYSTGELRAGMRVTWP